MDKKDKEEKKDKWTAEDIPTQTEPMVVNNEEEKAYPQAAVNAIILNKLETIEKAILD